MEQGDVLAKLGDLLTSPGFRAQFARDPDSALRNQGLDADDIDAGLYGVLSELTAAELRVLAEVGQALRDIGVDPDVSVRMV